MATMSELVAQGYITMRLPFWNQYAYARPNTVGPWAKIYDVAAGVGTGKPIARLIGECDLDDRWEPCYLTKTGRVIIEADIQRFAAEEHAAWEADMGVSPDAMHWKPEGGES